MGKKAVKTIVCLLIAAGLVVLDQWTKALAVANLQGTSGIVLIPGVFELQYVENTGIAFGLFSGSPVLFGIISSLIALIILFVIFNAPLKKRYIWVLITGTMLIAGSIGNLIDRLRLNYVIDFLYFSLIDFPVFNVADCYVTVATFVLAFLFLFIYKDEEFDVIFPFAKSKKTANPNRKVTIIPAKTNETEAAEVEAKAEEKAEEKAKEKADEKAETVEAETASVEAESMPKAAETATVETETASVEAESTETEKPVE